MRTETSSRVTVVRAGPEHQAALTGFYRRVWNPDITEAEVESAREQAAVANRAHPGEPPPTWLVLQDGDAIAHLTTIPMTLWIDRRERPAYWLKGLWVLPEFQRSAAGFLVLRAAASELTHALALVHEPAAARLFSALGFTELGGLPNRIRVLRAGALLRRLDPGALGLEGLPGWASPVQRGASWAAPLLGPAVDAAHALWSATASMSGGRVSIDVGARIDADEMEALWVAVRDELPPGGRRGATWFNDRYAPEGGYVLVRARSRGRVVGACVVKEPKAEGDARLGGIRLASLSDVLFRPRDAAVGLALLRGAETTARKLGADAMLCSASAAALRPLLTRRGYVCAPGNLRVFARVRDDAVRMPSTIDGWWVTRGDCEADGSF